MSQRKRKKPTLAKKVSPSHSLTFSELRLANYRRADENRVALNADWSRYKAALEQEIYQVLGWQKRPERPEETIGQMIILMDLYAIILGHATESLVERAFNDSPSKVKLGQEDNQEGNHG